MTVTPDGPDQMGRELAEGPAAVAATLAAFEEATEASAGALGEARRILLVGTGASSAMTVAAAPAWRRVRHAQGDHRPVIVREASAVTFGVDGDAIVEGDVVVAVSYRGTSPETVAAAELARRAGHTVIAVTRPGSSPLADVATLSVEVRCGEEEKGAATKSELATLAVLLALGGALSSDASTRAALEARLEAAVLDWAPCARLGRELANSERTWAVGLGVGEGIARAASLLWHEKVIRPAVAVSVSTFRHGPVEAVRRGDAVLVIDVGSSVPAQAAYMALLASELDRLGCVTAWIGPQLPATSEGLTVAGRDAGASLDATLRLQQLARATALAAGTYAEEFQVLLDIVRASPPLV